MKNQRLIQLAALAVAVVLVAASGRFLRSIDAQRDALGVSATALDIKNMPPGIAFTSVALGGFRGLAIDYFWIRAEMLRQQGRYYEANQLANWICKLQPRFVKVWAFHAWNLAWNMSVLTQTYKERWNWVHNGIKLLRDEGIKYNPKAVGLYRELGWIFFFKLGDFMDDYHLGYKRQWAWDMHRVLGEPPPDIQAEGVETQLAQILSEKSSGPAKGPASRVQAAAAERVEQYQDESTRRVKKWFGRIAGAPDTWEAFVADPKMAAFVQRCEQAGIHLRSRPPGESILNVVAAVEVNPTFFDEYQTVLTPTYRQSFDIQTGRLVLTPDAKALRDLLNDPQAREPMDSLLAFLRRWVLVHQFKLDPSWMLQLMERFGPIDWRLPDAHGMYWSSYGVHQTERYGVKDVQEFFGPNTNLNTDREMMFALQRLTIQGRLFFEPNIEQIERSVLDVLPDLRFVNATHRAYVTTAAKYDPTAGPIAGEDFRDGHQNYLRDAIRYFYLYGQQDVAAYYYEYLRDRYHLRNGQVNPEYQLPLADFVRDPEFTERLGNPQVAMSTLTSYLDQAMRFMVMGDGNTAAGLVRYARDDLYEWYRKSREDNPTERMKIPPFEVIFNDAARGRMVGGNVAANPDLPFVKARLWKSLPLQTQLAIYDDVIGPLRQQAEAIGRENDLAGLYPPPPGLEEHRQQVAAARKAQEARQDGQENLSGEELKRRAREGQLERSLPQVPAPRPNR